MSKENKSQDHIGVFIVVYKEGKVLLGERLGHRKGYFGSPGGRLEKDETLIDCAKRELKEETSLEEELTYVGVVREHQGGLVGDFIHFASLCRNPRGDVVLMEPDKCRGWKWYSLDNLPEPILPGHLAVIKRLREYRDSQGIMIIDIP
jgi:8-oxo-dGTP diphosphatase